MSDAKGTAQLAVRPLSGFERFFFLYLESIGITILPGVFGMLYPAAFAQIMLPSKSLPTEAYHQPLVLATTRIVSCAFVMIGGFVHMSLRKSPAHVQRFIMKGILLGEAGLFVPVWLLTLMSVDGRWNWASMAQLGTFMMLAAMRLRYIITSCGKSLKKDR